MKIIIQRAQELLQQASKKRTLVVGDLMMNRFVYGSVSRISPEAPVPVAHVSHKKAMPSGACNVASNLLALSGKATMAGIIGLDAVGVVAGKLGTEELIDYMTIHAEEL